MANEPDHPDREHEYFESIVSPMLRERRFAELYETIAQMLADERDADFRWRLMADLSHFLRYAGNDQASLKWTVRMCEEFDDPLAWSRLAAWYFFSPHRAPTREEMLTALGHYETALQRAWAADAWVRNVLFDICRVLTDLEDYPALEARMREVVKDLKNKREVDIPRIEGEWLNRVPDGKLDIELVARYRRLMAADTARFRRLRYETRPATLDDLE